MKINNYDLEDEVNEGAYSDDDLDDDSILGAENSIINVGDTVECIENTDYSTVTPTTAYKVISIDKRLGTIVILDDLGFKLSVNVEFFKLFDYDSI